GRGDKSDRRKARGLEFISGSRNSRERFVVIEIEKFAFVLSVKSGHEFLSDPFTRAPGAFMKITVTHDFIAARLEIAQPGNKILVLGCAPFPVIIRYNQKRSSTNAGVLQCLDNSGRCLSCAWRNIVNRNYK